jgi:hypothetical protein
MADTVSPAKNFETLTGLSGSLSQTAATPTFSSAVKTGQVNQTAAYVSFVLGSLTNANLVFQASYDNVSWFTKPLLDFATGSVSSGYYQVPVTSASMLMTQSQNIVIDIPSCYQYVRFGVFTSGTTTASSLAIAVGSGAI